MAKSGLHGSFLLATGLTLMAACAPMPESGDGASVPWKVLLMTGAVVSASFCRSHIEGAREQSAYKFIDHQAQLSAHAETAAVLAQTRAEWDAEQSLLQQVQPQQMMALPPQTISHQANPAITVNVPGAHSVAPQPSELLETPKQLSVDDAQNILFERIYQNKKKHLLIPAETGSGKTSLLLGVVDYYLKRRPESQFFFSTAKPGPFMGFEGKTAPDGKKHVVLLNMGRSYTVEPLISRMEWVVFEMVNRQKQRTVAEQTGKDYAPSPLILVLDEWLATLSLADTHTKEKNREWLSAPVADRGDKPINYKDRLVEIVNMIAIMGREDNVAVWLFGQDHQVQNAGINTGLQKNFGVVVPFKKGAEQAVEHALIGRAPIPTHHQGKEIYARATQHLDQNPDSYLAYSNIHGHEILTVPYLPDIKRKRLFNDTEEASLEPLSIVKTQSVKKDDPWEVIRLKKSGTELADAICQVYGCTRGSDAFDRAKLEVMAAIS